MDDSSWVGHCLRCHCDVHDGTYFATKDAAYCATCWLISFYNFPEQRWTKLQAEVRGHRQRGVPQATIDQLVRGALRAHARTMVAQKLEAMAPV